jgi:hypothetical protein
MIFFTFIMNVKAQQSKIDSLNKEILILKLKSQIDSLKSKQSIISQHVTDEEYAARQDAFKKDFINYQNELYDTKMHLANFQKQYRTGVILTVVGWGGLILGYALIVAGSSNYSSSGASRSELSLGVLSTLGGLISLGAGGIVIIDAHKHIGYAGRRRFTNEKSSYVR